MSERLTDNPSLFRLRVRYGKRDRLKYLGHLEVIHTIERIVRRAGLLRRNGPENRGGAALLRHLRTCRSCKPGSVPGANPGPLSFI